MTNYAGRRPSAALRSWRPSLRVIAAGMILAVGGPAFAQTAGAPPPADTVKPPAAAPSSGQIYEPAFFTRFAPSTALDMIRNIPGFSLDGGDDRRGFGQGGANVLINGRRTSGKSNGTIDALSRVSSESVVRIEILDGAGLSLPGLTGQVANVITRPKGVTGRWELNPQLREDTRPVLLRGDASVSGENGPLAWTLGVHRYGGYGSAKGPERVTNAGGDLVDLRQERGRGGGAEPGVNGSLTWLGRTGDVLNVNASMNFPDFGDLEVSRRSGPGQTDRERIFTSNFQGQNGEFGADYEFDVAGGRLKLIGLMREETGEDYSALTETYADLSPLTGGRFLSDYTAGERIARAEYTFTSGAGGDWQAAVEGAFNYLDASSLSETLQINGFHAPDGARDYTRVDENRAELSLTHTRSLAPGLDLQATLAGEYSELTQAGGAAREFVRPKGFVALAWKAQPDLDFNLRLERKVGQLDFGDFAASRDINNGTAQSGNSDLVPEQAWAVEIEANRRMGAWGAVKLKAFAAAIEDVVDQVPIYFCDEVRIAAPSACASPLLFERREGVGNIDSAESYGVSLEGTLNFDPVGFKGAKIDFEIEFEESRVTDPFTGEDRRISQTDISSAEAFFRHDVPGTSWAWGLGHERFLHGPRFSLTQRAQDHVKPGYTFYFVENKDVFGAKVYFQYMPSGPRETFTREVYLDGRDGPLSYVEDRERTFSDIFRFAISKSF